MSTHFKKASLDPFQGEKSLHPNDIENSLNPLHEAVSMLYHLGFRDGDKVHLKLLPAKNIPNEIAVTQNQARISEKKGFQWIDHTLVWTLDREGGLIERFYPWGDVKSYPNAIGYLRAVNLCGWQVYVRPNKGGVTDDDIKSCNKIFFEKDDCSKTDQLELLNNSGLEASLVVESQKSYHVYLNLDSDVDVEKFRVLQQRLIQKFNSDPKIQNPSRLMRLPGFYHWRWDTETEKLVRFKCSIVSQSDKVYSEQELTESLPAWDSAKWGKKSQGSRAEIRKEGEKIVVSFSEGELNPWDIRNFLPFLDGLKPNGRRAWITCKCPAHNGKSEDSLHIHASSGVPKCQKGCDAKAVYHAAKTRAVEAGYKLPEKGSEEYLAAVGLIQQQQNDAQYEKLTKLSYPAWKTLNVEKLNLTSLNLDNGYIYVIKSYKGSGKTEGIRPIVESHERGYAWFNRVALGREACNKLGFTWHTEDGFDSDNLPNKIGFTVESSLKFKSNQIDNSAVLLVDEADQVFEQCFGGTANKDGRRTGILKSHLEHLAAVLNGNGKAVYMSADISDSDVDYIRNCAPKNAEIRIIVNEYKPKLTTIDFDCSKDSTNLIKEMIESLKQGENIFLVDDTKDGNTGAKTIAQTIKELYPEMAEGEAVVEINSETSGDEAIRDYIKNINEASLTTRLLSCTPSVTSGISIINKRFNLVRGIFRGVLTVNSASQAIARVRGCQDIKLWSAERGLIWQGNRSCDPKDLDEYYQANYEHFAVLMRSHDTSWCIEKESYISHHWTKYCEISALRNLCSEQYRARLRVKLLDDGYEINDIYSESEDSIKAELRRVKLDLELQKALEVDEAEILTESEYQKLEDRVNAPRGKPYTPEELVRIAKYWLLKNYGANLISQVTLSHPSGEELEGYTAMYILDKSEKYASKLKNFYNLTQATEAEIFSADYGKIKAQIESAYGAGTFHLADMTWNISKRKFWEKLGVLEFLDPSRTYTAKDFEELGKISRRNKKKFRDILGFNPENMKDVEIVDSILLQLGLKYDKRKVQENKNREVKRTVSPLHWEYAQLYCQHRKEVQIEKELKQAGYSQSAEVIATQHQSVNNSSDIQLGFGSIAQSQILEPARSKEVEIIAITVPAMVVSSEEVKDYISALNVAISYQHVEGLVEKMVRTLSQEEITMIYNTVEIKLIRKWWNDVAVRRPDLIARAA